MDNVRLDREHLLALADAPLANALKINLPLGKRSARPAARIKTDPAPGDLTMAELRQRRVDQHSDKITKLLDYYATTSVPIERIAEHLKMSEEDTIAALKKRGRAA